MCRYKSYAGNFIKFQTWKIRISPTPCKNFHPISSSSATIRMNITNTKLLHVDLSLSYLSSSQSIYFSPISTSASNSCQKGQCTTGHSTAAATFWTQKFPLEKLKIVRLTLASDIGFRNKTTKKYQYLSKKFSHSVKTALTWIFSLNIYMKYPNQAKKKTE